MKENHPPVLVIMKQARYYLGKLVSATDDRIVLTHAGSAPKGTVDFRKEGTVTLQLKDVYQVISEGTPGCTPGPASPATGA